MQPLEAEYAVLMKKQYYRRFWRFMCGAFVACGFPSVLVGQTMKAPDITKQSTLYVVPYAHLDTQWRWEFPQTISEYLLKTMRVNFDYIDRYPHYVFNWTGANRYRLMKEYFPSDYERMRKYVAAGRWYPAGSSVEEGDVNLPSAEGIFRQILYGNSYFRKDFGKASDEYMLPDCFGFPASLPSILAHAGVKGFSTQKLNSQWQPAPKVGGPNSPEQTPEGIPFNVGVWVGPDGKQVLAALNPGGYGSNVYTDLSKEPAGTVTSAPQLTSEERARLTPQQVASMRPGRSQEQNWVKRIDLNGRVTGVFADYHYVGTGDIGGATQESTVKLLEAIVTKSNTVLPTPPQAAFAMGEVPASAPSRTDVKVGDGPVQVVVATADQLFKDISPSMMSRLPQIKGDIELINHSAGSLTSQAYHKRWVLRNEALADAAEKASVAAAWMGAQSYPQQRLNDAWILALGGHFHDTAAGTATPRSYEYAWNDDAIVANQFGGVLTSATQAIASGLDTEGEGVPVVVFNSLNIEREDVVEAKVTFSGAFPKAVRVTDPAGKEVPSQIEDGKILFLASAPSVGYSVYNVKPVAHTTVNSGLKVTNSSLENARYVIKLNVGGDVSSIYDKQLKKELLSAPMRLAISNDKPKVYPAWNMDFDQEQAAPRSYVEGTPAIRVKEKGPLRVSLEVTREAEGSRFTQTISLSAGDGGNRVEFGNIIDWKTLSANLKATFPLSASNEEATYNWDLGTIKRPNANERQFEVASHKWIDLEDKSGSYGVTILTDYKNGSDKPNDNTIRLTLLRSPGIVPPANGNPSPYSDQANQDWGHHEFVFGLMGHAADWRNSQTDWQAYRLNEPMAVFQAVPHEGTLGKSFSLVHLNHSRVRVLALKKAEESDEVILRMVEMDGKSAPDVRVSFAGPISAAREVNGQEQPVGDVTVEQGVLKTSFNPYQPRTFALRLGNPSAKLSSVESHSVALHYDLAAGSSDDTSSVNGGFDGKGNAFPAEMLPEKLQYHDVVFDLASAKTGNQDAVVAKGQTINLPEGKFNRVYILAASTDGDQRGVFTIGKSEVSLNIQNWTGFIGQWDTRLWKEKVEQDWAISANHATWPPEDMQERERRAPSPRYPEDYLGLKPGYLKSAGLAWYASHTHTSQGLNQPYHYSYLFAYPIDVPQGARTLVLPNNDKIRIFAVSTVAEGEKLTAASTLFDELPGEDR